MFKQLPRLFQKLSVFHHPLIFCSNLALSRASDFSIEGLPSIG